MYIALRDVFVSFGMHKPIVRIVYPIIYRSSPNGSGLHIYLFILYIDFLPISIFIYEVHGEYFIICFGFRARIIKFKIRIRVIQCFIACYQFYALYW